MLQQPRQVRRIANKIDDAANKALEAYIEGRVSEERELTGRILQSIENAINEDISGLIKWRAYALKPGPGKSAEEKRHGADLMGVLDVDINGYNTKKGFLAQAKRAEPSEPLKKTEWDRLVGQCHLMLQRTPDAFVFIYSKFRGVRIFPANSVVGLQSRNVFDLYNRGVGNLFELYIECFIGDLRLNDPKIETIDALAEFSVENVLVLSARAES